MSGVKASVDVEVPLRTAYNQWTQFESFPQFMSGVVAVRQLDDRHTRWVTEVAGARREFDAEIVEQLPDDRVAWRSVDGDLRHSGVVTFRPLERGFTRITVDLAWEPHGLLEKAGDAVGLDHMQVKADLERFREFIEARGAETGQWRGQVGEAERLRADDGDVVDVLVGQHEQLKDLMARVSRAEGEEKQRLFGEFVELLKAHEQGEQRVVHPVTRAVRADRSGADGGEATADARIGEEEQSEELIALTEAAEMSPDPGEFDAWFERLRHAILDHADREEQEEFPRLRRGVEPERLRSMAEELVAVQAQSTDIGSDD